MPIEIRKYPNRRLYRVDASRHTTFAELAELVRAGVAFEVWELKTGINVTDEVLAQVLADEVRRVGGKRPAGALIRSAIQLLATDFEITRVVYEGRISAEAGGGSGC